MCAGVTRSGSTAVDEARRVDALCELNVIEQALNVCRTTIVQDAWDRGQKLVVHGWFYGLSNGLLEDLKMNVDTREAILPVFEKSLAYVKSRYLPQA